MQTNQFKHHLLSAAALLLAMPAAYVITISVLKYGLGINGPFDASQSFLEDAGIKEPLGWNINLLILLGPIVAIALSVFQIMKIDWHFSKEQFNFHIVIQKRWFPIAVAAFGISVMAVLSLYMFGENCR
jgi:hypothetical protein